MIFVQFSHGLLCGQKILRQSKVKGEKKRSERGRKEREKKTNEEVDDAKESRRRREKRKIWTCLSGLVDIVTAKRMVRTIVSVVLHVQA